MNNRGFWTIDKGVILGSLLLFVLSTLDGVFTLWGLSTQAIAEANPVMQLMINKSTLGFMAIKLLLPIILGLLFWRIRNTSRKLVTYGLRLVLSAYLLVSMLHVNWIINLYK